MTLVFSLVVLALLILGLLNRKKEKKEWIQEERYEESGAWLDKRSGERGTYGSLDDEMEANRQFISRQGKINALAQDVLDFCFAHLPDFHTRSDQQMSAHFAFIKKQCSALGASIEHMLNGNPLQLPETSIESQDPLVQSLKKQALEFIYEEFPKLLNLEIEELKKLDRTVERMADTVLGNVR